MGRLRLTEVPALFWVLLAGEQARKRLRRVLAARNRAALRHWMEQQAEKNPAVQIGRGLAAGFAYGRGTYVQPEVGLPPGFEPPSAALRPPPEPRILAPWQANWARLRYACPDGDASHEVLWVEGRGRLCLTCERA
jgi:hypothetical protein